MNTSEGNKRNFVVLGLRERKRSQEKRNSRVCKSDFSLGWCDFNGSGEGEVRVFEGDQGHSWGHLIF